MNNVRNAWWLDAMDHLGALLAAGIPLSDALHHAARMAPKPLVRWLQEGEAAVTAGQPLSQAWQPVCPQMLWLLLRASEHTGDVAGACARWCEDVRARQDWQRQVWQSASYPSALILLAFGLLAFVRGAVLPAFMALYAQMGGIEPRFLAMLAQAMVIIPAALGLAVAGYALCLAALWRARDRIPGAARWAKRLTPGFRLWRLARTHRFCLLLSRLLMAGIPAVEALAAMAEAAPRTWLAAVANAIRLRILAGQSLPQAFAADWDPVFGLLLQQAEHTGELAEAVRRMEWYSRDRLRTGLDRAARTAEPVLLVLLGAMIGIIMFAVFVPTYHLISTVSTGARTW
ncbi:type II secretion system protein GspF [Alicyclobacillus cellulosilyticus]|uniref:Type II secretion system protein GspF n=1 Tax=Alicyclobacillus cellulosilyticus TaxID=1003997 RepID=A0A917NET3_9BACL|nr:type II secretion system F family protein [Alicyclobacillus cellulosilyticus]GGI96124.1 type II secretion system protein GspF [Alicyclobacillus cellulosilyticus]